MTAEVFTDGSCNPQTLYGSWAAIIFIDGVKYIESGTAENTTHNRMELLAVIKSLAIIQRKSIKAVKIISDSQYVIGIERRLPKFTATNFKTKAGIDIRNVDLVKELVGYFNQLKIEFIKIKAHQKQGNEINYNIEVDKICRQLVRKS